MSPKRNRLSKKINKTPKKTRLNNESMQLNKTPKKTRLDDEVWPLSPSLGDQNALINILNKYPEEV